MERLGLGIEIDRQLLEAELLNEGRDHALALPILGDRHDHQRRALALRRQRLEGRHLRHTGQAPGGPEIDQHRPALEIREPHRLAGARAHGEVGRWPGRSRRAKLRQSRIGSAVGRHIAGAGQAETQYQKDRATEPHAHALHASAACPAPPTTWPRRDGPSRPSARHDAAPSGACGRARGAAGAARRLRPKGQSGATPRHAERRLPENLSAQGNMNDASEPRTVAPGFAYRAGELHIEDVPLARIADSVGTPVYCYSSGAIAGAYHRFAQALAAEHADIHYAVKANSNQAVIRLLAKL